MILILLKKIYIIVKYNNKYFKIQKKFQEPSLGNLGIFFAFSKSFFGSKK
jgi:hypothetical protein